MASTSKSTPPTEHELAVRAPVMTILSDHPILRDVSDEKSEAARECDAFELHTRLGAVYDIVRHQNTRAPLAIGIFGDWGTGKSSAMRWLAEQLTIWTAQGNKCKPHCRCRCVWFEPWKYQTRDDVWRGLIAEVILRSIDPKAASVATVVNAAKKFGTFLGRSFIHAVSSIELVAKADTGKALPNVGVEGKIDLDSLTKIAEDYKQTVRPEKAYLNEFESTLKSWVAESLGSDERMVLFIDDLDRCLPAIVLEVLEALKLYLNIPQLVFVVGLDRDVVKAVIRKHYKDAGLGELKADSYLDKMFQVEVEVPPSEGQMDGYFDAQIAELNAATNNYWTNQLNKGGAGWKDVIEEAIKAIALHNPREVKRLLNSTLMGGAAAARKARDENDAAKRFGQGCQAYLIARVLRDMDGNPAATLRLKDTWTFLEKWSAFTRTYPLYRPDAVIATDSKERGAESPATIDLEQKKREEEVRQFMPRTRDAKREPYPLWDNSVLWNLLAIDCSAEVGQAIASRSVEAKIETPTLAAVSMATIPEPTTAGLTFGMASIDIVGRLPLIVRSRAAGLLKKDAKDLTPKDLASITELILSGSDLDDDGLRAIARPDTGLKALTSLNLSGTRVTDEGVAALASKDTAFQSLTTLFLNDTQVTDKGIAALASKDTGLKALTSLHLGDTQVTDEGITALASKDTGLNALTVLQLGGTDVTDKGIAALASRDGGIRALSRLNLMATQVTDVGVAALASKDTSLRSLVSLHLSNTRVTDAGIVALASKDTGIKTLALLHLDNTRVTDIGIAAIASKDAALKALASLDISYTLVTDVGMMALSSKDAGPTSIKSLYLAGARVTDMGVAALASQNTSMKELTSLRLMNTAVTDNGLAKLASADSGLRSLSYLDLDNTRITNAGAMALASDDTGLVALSILDLRRSNVSAATESAIKRRFPEITIFR